MALVSLLGQEVDGLWKKYYNDLATQFPMLELNPFVTSDIAEFEDRYEITCDLPGVQKESVKISVQRGMLKISGKRESKSDVATSRFVSRERFVGEYTRSFSLPDDAHVKSAKALHENGVLTIVLPKCAKDDAYSIPIGA